jgi:hypothetical protein
MPFWIGPSGSRDLAHGHKRQQTSSTESHRTTRIWRPAQCALLPWGTPRDGRARCFCRGESDRLRCDGCPPSPRSSTWSDWLSFSGRDAAATYSTGRMVPAPIRSTMPDDKLTPADPDDLAAALAFALRFDGRRRKNDAAEFMADLVAKRLVRHIERAGFVVMKRPPIGGGAALGRGFEG